MSPEEFYAHAMRAADTKGRLPLSRMTAWDVFPFGQTGLQVVPLARPALPEPDRAGENGLDCPACTAGRVPVWSDEHWRLSVLGPSGAPLVLLLELPPTTTCRICPTTGPPRWGCSWSRSRGRSRRCRTLPGRMSPAGETAGLTSPGPLTGVI